MRGISLIKLVVSFVIYYLGKMFVSLLRRTDFNPVSIRIVDKVNPHIRIFKADAVHFFVEFKRRVHIIRLKGEVEFVVPQIIWPVHVAKPSQFQKMGRGLIAHEHKLEAAVFGFGLPGNGKTKRLFVEFDGFFQIQYIDVVMIEMKVHKGFLL